jgi:LysM repeat protein
MVDRKPVRYLAPVALVVTIAGVYLIVHHNSTSHSSPAPVQHARSTAAKGKYAGQQFYVVQQGDILSKISQKTGVPVNALEALNPNIAPNSLQVGQRLRLRR